MGIIGIVAEMVLPTILIEGQEKQTLSALKKQASSLDQALNLAVVNEGQISDWYLDDVSVQDATLATADVLEKYLKISKKCTDTDDSCFTVTTGAVNKTLSNAVNINSSLAPVRYILADGSSIGFRSNWASGAGISYILFYIDTNGLKSPNRFGRDVFVFQFFSPQSAISINLVPNSMYPYGYNYKSGALNVRCSQSSSVFGVNGAGAGGGSMCSAWAYYNGNMDYLHCDDLDWQTKFECD